MNCLLFKLKRKIYKLTHPAFGEVLMLHRVTNERSILQDNRILEITPVFLEQIILKYKSQGYRFVSLDDIYHQMTAKQSYKQRFVCFTFDDGYRDNYEIAYPILKKHNVPFAIYLTTDFADGKALFWWYILEDLLLNSNEIKLSDGSAYKCHSLQEKNLAFLEIKKKAFFLQSGNMQDTLNKLLSTDIFSYDVDNKMTLTWEQIKLLSQDSLCTIASHTLSHPALTKLLENDIIHELAESKQKIEGQIEKEVFHFAYPYGDYNDNVMTMALNQGYHTVALINGGLVRRGDIVEKLKRNILIEK